MANLTHISTLTQMPLSEGNHLGFQDGRMIEKQQQQQQQQLS